MSDQGPPAPRKRYYPMWELIVARLREFCREPAAIFWVYVFPLIMVVALGIAFRNRPVEKFEIVVQEADRATAARDALAQDSRSFTQCD